MKIMPYLLAGALTFGPVGSAFAQEEKESPTYAIRAEVIVDKNDVYKSDLFPTLYELAMAGDEDEQRWERQWQLEDDIKDAKIEAAKEKAERATGTALMVGAVALPVGLIIYGMGESIGDIERLEYALLSLPALFVSVPLYLGGQHIRKKAGHDAEKYLRELEREKEELERLERDGR